MKLINATNMPNYSHLNRDKNMPRKNPFLESHTNLHNEITGAYYEDTLKWYHHVGAIVVLLVLILVIADFIFGAEAVTYWISQWF